MNPFEGFRISSPYGYRIHPISKKKKFHRGIDLVKPHRTPIEAFVSGTVIWASIGRPGTGYGNYGNVVAVKDDKGYTHVYAHLDSIAVKLKQQVNAGQVVGRQGNTGASAGSHLHYEVRRAGYGTDVEPTQYLIDYYKGDDEEVKLSDGEWKLLETSLQSLYNKKILTSTDWIESAKKRTLTHSDICFIMVLLIDRLHDGR